MTFDLPQLAALTSEPLLTPAPVAVGRQGVARAAVSAGIKSAGRRLAARLTRLIGHGHLTARTPGRRHGGRTDDVTQTDQQGVCWDVCLQSGRLLPALVCPPQVDAAQRAAAGPAAAGVAGAARGEAPPLQHRHQVPALPVQREDLPVQTHVPQAACKDRGSETLRDRRRTDLRLAPCSRFVVMSQRHVTSLNQLSWRLSFDAANQMNGTT